MSKRKQMAGGEKQRIVEGRLFAIGDIHGCPDELRTLLSALKPAAGDTVVFIGDYIDRGPSARDVIETLLELPASGCEPVFLKGNHEDMMLSFMGKEGHYGDSFLFNGGISTLESYGIREADFAAAAEKVPAAHMEFYERLKVSFLATPYLFVHAGVQPLRAWEEQDTEDLLWIRQEFIVNTHDLGRTVVFGHTPMRDVLFDLPYKVGIDTGLVYGGKLTAMELREGALYQVSRGSHNVRSRKLDLRGAGLSP